MEIVLFAVVVVALGAFIYYNRSSKSLDVNNDGKVDAADVAVVKEKAKAVAKKTTAKVKETAKKAAPRGRKPQAK